jgi:hypothetical protein
MSIEQYKKPYKVEQLKQIYIECGIDGVMEAFIRMGGRIHLQSQDSSIALTATKTVELMEWLLKETGLYDGMTQEALDRYYILYLEHNQAPQLPENSRLRKHHELIQAFSNSRLRKHHELIQAFSEIGWRIHETLGAFAFNPAALINMRVVNTDMMV